MRVRKGFEGEGGKAFAYMDDTTLGFMGVKASMFGAMPFRRCELAGIGIDTNPSKTVLGGTPEKARPYQ